MQPDPHDTPSINWQPCRDCSDCMVASDDDEGWEMHATDGGFDISWGCLELSCDADNQEIAKQEAEHLLEALLAWGKGADARAFVRRCSHA